MTDRSQAPDLPPAPERRDFFTRLAGLTLLTATAAACGGGGDDDNTAPPPPGPPPPGGLACGATAISGNHGHTLTIPAADVDSPTAKTYSIAGTSGHDHTITLSPAQLALIKARMAVTVTSSTDFAHAHDVTVNCA